MTTDKINYCSAAFYCLANNVIQQSECEYFLPSVVVKHKNCLMFKTGRCFCADAKMEATARLVDAVKNNYGRMDE